MTVAANALMARDWCPVNEAFLRDRECANGSHDRPCCPAAERHRHAGLTFVKAARGWPLRGSPGQPLRSPSMTVALACIQMDHHSFASVLTCLQAELREVAHTQRKPNFRLIEQILTYVAEFLDTYHHPKEDEYLFRLLRLREPAMVETLNNLRDDHHRGKVMLKELWARLADWKRGATGADAAFMVSYEAYHMFEREHVRAEERIVLPRATAALTAADWLEVNAAFLKDRDPLFDSQATEHFVLLRAEIDRLSPPPYGRGEAA